MDFKEHIRAIAISETLKTNYPSEYFASDYGHTENGRNPSMLVAFYCVGMSLMTMTRAKSSVIIFSWAAGVMYSTLFTMPYLLVSHYHSMGTFELDSDGTAKLGSNVCGLGTDVAIVSSMVFLAQFILFLCMGTIVSISGTTTAVVSTASFLSLSVM